MKRRKGSRKRDGSGKRFLSGLTAIVLVGGMCSACSRDVNKDVLYMAEAKAFEALSVEKRAEVDLEERGYTAISDFTDATLSPLYQMTIEQGDDNFLYSPTSLYLALAVLAESEDPASKGPEELYGLLGVSDSEELVGLVDKLTASLVSDGKGDICQIGNSLWADDDNTWLEGADTVWKKLSQNFGADIFQMDLQAESAGVKKNKWISEHTGGLLGNGKPEPWDVDVRMVIMNTVYFDKTWKEPFETDRTRELAFTKADGSEVVCQMMNQSRSGHAYLQTDSYLASALEYQDGSYMLFMLPQEGVAPEDLLVSDLTDAVEQYRKKETERADIVHFSVPNLDYTLLIKKIEEQLQNLGISEAFGTTAFRHISEDELFVSSITQNVRIQVGEEGTKAAAVTEITMVNGAGAVPETVIEMNLNRPYAYAIVSANGTILFAGVVNDPTSEN